MALSAKWGGICEACGASYPQGAPIGRLPSGRWGHAACAGEAQPAPAVSVLAEVVRVTCQRDNWSAARVRHLQGEGPQGQAAPGAYSVAGALPPDCQPGDRLRLTGRWEAARDSRWGDEFRVNVAIRELTADNKGAVALLTSVRGVGDARASQIVEAAGGPEALVGLVVRRDEATLAGLLAEHGRLSEARAREAAEALCAESGKAEALAYLAGLGLGPSRCAAALARWGADAKELVEDDPYVLMILDGVGWATADAVGRAQGLAQDDPRRARAAAQFALETATGEGHTWSCEASLTGQNEDVRDVVAQAAQQTGVPTAALVAGLASLFVPRTVHTRAGTVHTLPPVAARVEVEGEWGTEERIQPVGLAYAEAQCAMHLRRLMAGAEGIGALDVPGAALEGLHEHQAEAVRAVAETGVTVVTGGPGVGKTHVTKRLLDVLEYNGLKVACCAPTGKAALRMRELTGRPSQTIHRLLEWSPAEGQFKRGEENPLDADCVVCDESSMVDVSLARRLLSAVRTGARLVLVGDVDQLPSVAPGGFFRDVIESGTVRAVRLIKIFRQAQDSPIPWVARAINEGQEPDLDHGDKVRLICTDPDEQEATGQATVEAVFEAADALGVGVEDVQVLVPMKREAAGVFALNSALQGRICPLDEPGKSWVRIGGGDRGKKAEGDDDDTTAKASVGDRVMQTKNNYDLITFNGEIGRVVAANPQGLSEQEINEAAEDHEVVTSHKSRVAKARQAGDEAEAQRAAKREIVLIVSYPSPENGGFRLVGYTKAESWDLNLAYAITIHKSQGSSWPVVVVVAHRAHVRMLERALVYTAITRAEQACWIVGQQSAVGRAARTVLGAARRTTLRERLVEGVNEVATPDVED